VVIVVAVGSGLIILVAVLVLRPLLLGLSERAESRAESQPLPLDWLSFLDRAVPASRHLTDAQSDKLLRLSRELMHTRHWEGCRGLVLTEEMQLTIAAQACLLSLELPGEPFPLVREILVYPGTFVAHHIRDRRDWQAERRDMPLLGESWGNGVMVLSWDAVQAGARQSDDGDNVVIHEFAHELDFEWNLTPFNPPWLAETPPYVAVPAGWRDVLKQSYERLCAKVEQHTPSALRAYGATNIHEFLAVATETFFEKPVELAREEPDLYAQLVSLYRQDPARSLGA
jgi:MtfA peptidase